jgi:hypothetical protein
LSTPILEYIPFLLELRYLSKEVARGKQAIEHAFLAMINRKVGVRDPWIFEFIYRALQLN